MTSLIVRSERGNRPVLGRIRISGGKLIPDPQFRNLVRGALQRNNGNVKQSLAELSSFNNGYVSVRLEKFRQRTKKLTAETIAEQLVELSAETPGLVATPAPYGKPGGPGLYGVKGMKHSNYFEHIVQALIRNGMSPGHASAVAWEALRRWAHGGGNVHPEVRAAAQAALREEQAKAARAKATTNESDATITELTETATHNNAQRIAALKRQIGELKAAIRVKEQQLAVLEVDSDR
jgi:hypothetical protein